MKAILTQNLKIIAVAILSIIVFVSAVVPAYANVWVNGYTKSNGTYVQGYWRSSPDSSPYNNWSYPGNTNPYTGVTAGGNADSYLRNYYDDYSYSNYSVPSYSYSSYYGLDPDDIYQEVANGWKSYGLLNCNSGYYEKSNRCVKDPKNGKMIGSTLYCNYGYEKDGNRCIKPVNGSYNYLGGIVCDKNYTKVGDKCKKTTAKLLCSLSFGEHAIAYDEDSCLCEAGYQWSSSGDSCVVKPNKEIKYIRSYVKMIGDSTVQNCNEIGWVNQDDVDNCTFYKSNKFKYDWKAI